MSDPLLQRVKAKTGDTRFNRAVVADVAPEATCPGDDRPSLGGPARQGEGGRRFPSSGGRLEVRSGARTRGAVVFEKDKRRLLVWFGKKGTVSMVGFDDQAAANA